MTVGPVLSTGTRTVLFTDLVDSTALRTRVGDDIADELRRTHDALLRDAVSAFGGSVVKGTGDGLLVAFDGAADGVGCAIAMQQAMARFSRRAQVDLRLRIGLSAGDVAWEDGDFFGTPVVEAARLEAAAQPDQILAAELVRVLAGSRTDAVFSSVGGLTLKGLPETVPTCEIAWELQDTGVEIPEGLRVLHGSPFVDRVDELGWLETLWQRGAAGERAVVLIGGEHGIGKTRLVAELADRVHRHGARVLYGAAVTHAGTSGEPLVDALHGYVSTASRADLRLEVADDGEQLARLVPLLADRLAGLAAATATGGRDAPFDVVDRFLSRVAAAVPLLVVLDDLDRADAGTLRGLRHLAASGVPAAVLVVGCYRDARAGLPTPLAELIAEVGRVAHLEQRTLHSLDEAGVAALLAARVQEPLGADVVGAVHEETGGNPQLVLRAARVLRERHVADRMGDAVAKVEAARVDLRQVRETIVNDVLELQQLRASATDEPAGVIGTAVDPEGTPPARVPCPYKGLVRFEANDAEWFCGRERLVADLVARLVSARMVGVVGASGSGKSSLVRAGLLPALRAGALPESGTWRELVMTPGAEPLRELALALSPLGRGIPPDEILRRLGAGPGALDAVARQAVEDHDDARLVLVVDQFEEVFTNCRSEQERRRFIDELLHASACAGGPTLVVGVIRADFYGRCAEHEPLATQLSEAQLLVGPMSEPELRRAIEKPARRAGLVLEPGLVDALLRDVGDEPAGLPLLSTALLETWERRRGRSLTLAGYAETGGVRGAVARLAEGVWELLDSSQQAAARRIFLCLAEPGEGRDDVRRRAPLTELLGDDDGVGAVLHTLVARRLVVTDDATVEVAHEALLREWPRLRDWLEEDREGRRLQRHIAQAASEWTAAGREPEQLYRGTRLGAAEEWAAAHPSEVRAPELEFIDAGRAQQEAEQHRARRRARGLRVLAAGLALLLVMSVVAGFAAFGQRNRADHAARLAFAGRLAAQARNVGADQLDLSLLLAVQSRRLVRSNATDGGLEAVLARVPPGFEYSARIPPTAGAVAASPDGRLLAVPGTDGQVHLLDRDRSWRTGRTLAGLPGGAGVAFSADGTKVLASGTGKVMVWNVRTGAPVGPPLDGGGPVSGTFDPADSTRLFTAAAVTAADGTTRGTVVHWDLGDPQHPRIIGPKFSDFPQEPDDSPLMNLSPDGRLVAAGSHALATTYVWDTRSGARLHAPALDGIDGGFTSDSALLMLARGDRIVFVNPATGVEQGSALTGFRLPNPAIVISRDGRYAAASDFIDNSMRVFDLTSRQQVGRSLAVFSGLSYPVEFLPGERLVTVDAGRLISWRFTDQTPPLAQLLPNSHRGVVVPRFTPDGAQVITVDEDHVAHRWRASDGADLGRFLDDRAAPTYNVAFSPDGRTVATNRRDGTAGLFDVATGTPLSVLDAHQAHGTAQLRTAWSPDGKVVATASDDLSLVLWDVSDPRHPRVRARLQTATARREGLYPFFSHDGRLLLVTNLDAGTATTYDVASGRRLWVYKPIGVGVAFSPDGATVAVGSYFGRVGVTMIDTASGRTRARVDQIPPNQGFEFAAGGKWLVVTLNPVTGPEPPPGTNLTGINTIAILLYDAKTFQQIGEPITLSGSLPYDWAISPDGTRYATGAYNSPDGAAAVWDLDPDRWATTACRIARRNLTRAEWAQYLPGRPYQQTCPRWPAGN